MNLELYSEEFKSFKLLKLSPEFAAYFRMVGNMVDSIQPGPGANDPSFSWPFRVEFVEQLLDLSEDSVYIVDTTSLEQSRNFYEDAILYEVKNPVIYLGNMFMPDLGKVATLEDIHLIENNWVDEETYLLCPKEYRDTFHDQEEALKNIISVKDLPIVPKRNIGYLAMFAKEEVAKFYRDAVTTALRNKKAAVSAISRYF